MIKGDSHALAADLVFRDRIDAGAQLASCLEKYRADDPLILAIPRGGVPVGAEIARHLDAELDIVVARKLGAPYQPELAIGAVTADGGWYINKALVRQTGVTDAFLQRRARLEMVEAYRRERRLRGDRARPDVKDRTVIVVDDGLATGATMRAAVRSVRAGQPARIVVAVPVAPPQTCAVLRTEADEVIALYEPDPFIAVGLHYADFEPTTEWEIQQLLLENLRRPRRERMSRPVPDGV